MKKHLVREFCQFYNRARCQHAPANPWRVLNLARLVYEDYPQRLNAEAFLSVLYEPLQGVFARFDPAKYKGSLPLDCHFVNYFKKT